MYKDKRKFYQIKKFCDFCKDKSKDLDYKNIKVLQKYISFYGKIESSKKTGCCARHQRILTREIKKARSVGLLPFVSK